MKRRFIRSFLAILLLLCLIPTAAAAEHGITDIVGHWAEDAILWTVDQGLFRGTSDATFDPNGSMTRGMFVTVLGRFAEMDKDDYEDWYLPELFADLDCRFYYAPYINWAVRTGIAKGTGPDTFCPDDAITREQMAVFLVRFAEAYGYEFESIREDVPEAFDDMDTVAPFAREAVDMMRRCGLLTGRLNAAGGYDFDPRALAVRSECAMVFFRLAKALVPNDSFDMVQPEEVTVTKADQISWAMPGDTFSLHCDLSPMNVTNETLLWVSSDPEVASVDIRGTVTCHAVGTAEIYAYSWNGPYDYYVIDVTDDVYIGYKGESKDSKCMNIFGRVVKDPRHPYTNNADPAEFVENLVTVEVRCWDFVKGSKTEKYTRVFKVQVHKNLAATVEALFEEIYACEEQYPIHSLGGYRWSKKSEHTPGLALDVNANENPYVDPKGNILVGKVFDPENNPYSIPLDGEVEQIFEKYGFRRGTWWSSGYKDYMHFSFFGT